MPTQEETIKEETQPEQEIQILPPIQQQVEDKPKAQEPSIGGKWYTSSYHTTKYYYHESCQGWQGLSEKYLKVFNSEAELLSKYNRTLHPDCNPY